MVWREKRGRKPSFRPSTMVQYQSSSRQSKLLTVERRRARFRLLFVRDTQLLRCRARVGAGKLARSSLSYPAMSLVGDISFLSPFLSLLRQATPPAQIRAALSISILQLLHEALQLPRAPPKPPRFTSLRQNGPSAPLLLQNQSSDSAEPLARGQSFLARLHPNKYNL